MDDEDILSNVRNLFIQEESESGAEGDLKVPDVEEGTKPDLNIVYEEEKAELQATETKPVDIIIDSKKEREGGIPSEKPSENEKNPKQQQTPKQTPKQQDKFTCKSSSDCDKNTYCLLKSGKCTVKLQIGQSGCTSNEACLNAACLGTKCVRACVNNSDCGKGEGCSSVTDSREVVFKGLEGAESLKGVCEAAGASGAVETKAHDHRSPSVAVISGISASSILLLLLVFLYIRRRLKRTYHNKNPDMFLFEKLQRSASQNGLMNSATRSGSGGLNSRLSGVSGARFTRWAVLSAADET